MARTRQAWRKARRTPLSRRAVALLLVVGALVHLALPPASRYWRAGELLVGLSGGEARAPIVEHDLMIRGRGGPIRARLYRRADRAHGEGLVVAHGVHYQGIDERRLVPFARALAASGLVVLTPELGDLTDYRITAQGAGVVADSVRYLSARRDLLTHERVGVLGFSFAGGLSLVAASEPELVGKLSYVTSVGGHHDLARVLRFLLTSQIETPDGVRTEQAHEYGQVVLAYGQLGSLVPAADQAVMREALRSWLHEDRERAFVSASRRVTPEGERLWRLVSEQRLDEIEPQLSALLAGRQAELAALSPSGKLAGIPAPVYLLHGSGDSVIPASETEWAERELENTGHPHLALVSPLLEHVEVEHAAAWRDQLALLRFMARLL